MVNKTRSYLLALQGLRRYEVMDYRDAVWYCEESLKLNEKNELAYLYRGYALQKMGNLNLASQSLEMAKILLREVGDNDRYKYATERLQQNGSIGRRN